MDPSSPPLPPSSPTHANRKQIKDAHNNNTPSPPHTSSPRSHNSNSPALLSSHSISPFPPNSKKFKSSFSSSPHVSLPIDFYTNEDILQQSQEFYSSMYPIHSHPTFSSHLPPTLSSSSSPSPSPLLPLTPLSIQYSLDISVTLCPIVSPLPIDMKILFPTPFVHSKIFNNFYHQNHSDISSSPQESFPVEISPPLSQWEEATETSELRTLRWKRQYYSPLDIMKCMDIARHSSIPFVFLPRVMDINEEERGKLEDEKKKREEKEKENEKKNEKIKQKKNPKESSITTQPTSPPSQSDIPLSAPSPSPPWPLDSLYSQYVSSHQLDFPSPSHPSSRFLLFPLSRILFSPYQSSKTIYNKNVSNNESKLSSDDEKENHGDNSADLPFPIHSVTFTLSAAFYDISTHSPSIGKDIISPLLRYLLKPISVSPHQIQNIHIPRSTNLQDSVEVEISYDLMGMNDVMTKVKEREERELDERIHKWKLLNGNSKDKESHSKGKKEKEKHTERDEKDHSTHHIAKNSNSSHSHLNFPLPSPPSPSSPSPLSPSSSSSSSSPLNWSQWCSSTSHPSLPLSIDIASLKYNNTQWEPFKVEKSMVNNINNSALSSTMVSSSLLSYRYVLPSSSSTNIDFSSHNIISPIVFFLGFYSSPKGQFSSSLYDESFVLLMEMLEEKPIDINIRMTNRRDTNHQMEQKSQLQSIGAWPSDPISLFPHTGSDKEKDKGGKVIGKSIPNLSISTPISSLSTGISSPSSPPPSLSLSSVSSPSLSPSSSSSYRCSVFISSLFSHSKSNHSISEEFEALLVPSISSSSSSSSFILRVTTQFFIPHVDLLFPPPSLSSLIVQKSVRPESSSMHSSRSSVSSTSTTSSSSSSSSYTSLSVYSSTSYLSSLFHYYISTLSSISSLSCRYVRLLLLLPLTSPSFNKGVFSPRDGANSTDEYSDCIYSTFIQQYVKINSQFMVSSTQNTSDTNEIHRPNDHSLSFGEYQTYSYPLSPSFLAANFPYVDYLSCHQFHDNHHRYIHIEGLNDQMNSKMIHFVQNKLFRKWENQWGKTVREMWEKEKLSMEKNVRESEEKVIDEKKREEEREVERERENERFEKERERIRVENEEKEKESESVEKEKPQATKKKSTRNPTNIIQTQNSHLSYRDLHTNDHIIPSSLPLRPSSPSLLDTLIKECHHAQYLLSHHLSSPPPSSIHIFSFDESNSYYPTAVKSLLSSIIPLISSYQRLFLSSSSSSSSSFRVCKLFCDSLFSYSQRIYFPLYGFPLKLFKFRLPLSTLIKAKTITQSSSSSALFTKLHMIPSCSSYSHLKSHRLLLTTAEMKEIEIDHHIGAVGEEELFGFHHDEFNDIMMIMKKDKGIGGDGHDDEEEKHGDNNNKFRSRSHKSTRVGSVGFSTSKSKSKLSTFRSSSVKSDRDDININIMTNRSRKSQGQARGYHGNGNGNIVTPPLSSSRSKHSHRTSFSSSHEAVDASATSFDALFPSLPPVESAIYLEEIPSSPSQNINHSSDLAFHNRRFGTTHSSSSSSSSSTMSPSSPLISESSSSSLPPRSRVVYSRQKQKGNEILHTEMNFKGGNVLTIHHDIDGDRGQEEKEKQKEKLKMNSNSKSLSSSSSPPFSSPSLPPSMSVNVHPIFGRDLLTASEKSNGIQWKSLSGQEMAKRIEKIRNEIQSTGKSTVKLVSNINPNDIEKSHTFDPSALISATKSKKTSAVSSRMKK